MMYTAKHSRAQIKPYQYNQLSKLATTPSFKSSKSPKDKSFKPKLAFLMISLLFLTQISTAQACNGIHYPCPTENSMFISKKFTNSLGHAKAPKKIVYYNYKNYLFTLHPTLPKIIAWDIQGLKSVAVLSADLQRANGSFLTESEYQAMGTNIVFEIQEDNDNGICTFIFAPIGSDYVLVYHYSIMSLLLEFKAEIQVGRPVSQYSRIENIDTSPYLFTIDDSRYLRVYKALQTKIYVPPTTVDTPLTGHSLTSYFTVIHKVIANTNVLVGNDIKVMFILGI